MLKVWKEGQPIPEGFERRDFKERGGVMIKILDLY